jgi:hypothetical protein
MNGREGVISNQQFPGRTVFSRLRQREPSLDVFARWTCVIARRHQVEV